MSKHQLLCNYLIICTSANYRFTIGRGLAADFVIESRVVSRTHCILEKLEDNWTLTDSSTNGTLVNEELYKGALTAQLKHKDEICLGLAECTYKFLLRDESVPNSQIERLRMEENSSPRPNSWSSFDENGISDDVLNNLADDLLSQKDNEDKIEDENQPSTSSNAENIPVINEAQINLPTSSNESVQNLNNNNPIEENNELENSTSSVETIIDLDHDYANGAQLPVPNSPNTIDITGDEPGEVTRAPSFSTNTTSVLKNPMSIDITDDNNTYNSDGGNSSTTSSTSTITYSLPEDLQTNENAGSSNRLPISGSSSNRPELWVDLRKADAACSEQSDGFYLPYEMARYNDDSKRIKLQCVTSSNMPTHTSSASTITHSLPENLQTNENAGPSNILPVFDSTSNRPEISAASSEQSDGFYFINGKICLKKDLPYELAKYYDDCKRIKLQSPTSSNMPTMCSLSRTFKQPTVFCIKTNNIGNVQAGSSVRTPGSQQENPSSNFPNPIKIIRIERNVIQNTATTTNLPQNTETKEKSPPKISQDAQRPGTSKDSEKCDELEPPKQLNQGLDQNAYEEMENELMCVICSNLFIKAVTLGCSHSFCQYCIESWKKNKTDCPICRTKMVSTTRTLVLDNIIEKMMDNASEEDKKLRKEVIDERQKIADAEIAAKNQQQAANARGGRNGRGSRNVRRRNHRPPAGPVLQPMTSPSSSDSSGNITEDSEDLEEYYNDNWYDRPYYGGYGRCYVCGESGHWANGCPYR
ncbi:unnamed protein product [Ceutorhynchus assimilis]|uniref:E3 ubiquitin-protein ligase CHFR n=1 Tax=Ceutorhynchus assimilis TaxID=467358 RepID=A0A9N9MXP5_9CUCU|nr:unnamed protein product [Ceutorhynchus assimilis]